jgi:hypothetical protein
MYAGSGAHAEQVTVALNLCAQLSVGPTATV